MGDVGSTYWTFSVILQDTLRASPARTKYPVVYLLLDVVGLPFVNIISAWIAYRTCNQGVEYIIPRQGHVSQPVH